MTLKTQIDLKALISRQRPGMTLEQPFYTSPDIFEQDLERIVAKQWLFVDHECEIPNKGDYLLYEIAGESIILVRGRDETIRAFFNVCRHRGSRICLEPKGNVRSLTCPYHAWSWDLEGDLKGARLMSQDFNPADWPLHRCRIAIWYGLIFINLGEEDDPDCMDFMEMQEALERYLAPFRLDQTRIVTKKDYPTPGNWKLAVENFRECYHCAPAHPEYTMVNAYVRETEYDPAGRLEREEEWRQHWAARGHATDNLRHWETNRLQPYGAFRQPIREGYLTLTQDGAPAAPLMGDLEAFDGGETLLILGPLNYIYLAGDHATLFRFTPVDETMTDVTLTWLVRGDAKPEEVDEDKIVWMWDVTTIADTRIIGDNQLGVNSRRYRPGPYSEHEGGSRRFAAWYLDRLSHEC